jgi:N-acetylglutamate synthase-like GNAT family acetyltransferase/protein-L-isoaspartate O-methyltransferase
MTEQKSEVLDLYTDRARRLPLVTEVPASFGLGDLRSIARFSPGETVLDLGSGPGRDLLLAAEAVGPTGRAIGVDLISEMRDRARAAAEARGLRNVSVIEGDLESLPIPSNSIDVVISNCVINLVSDKRTALAEAFRVLRPGGRLAVLDTAFTTEPGEQVRADSSAWACCEAGGLVESEYVEMLEGLGFSHVNLDRINSGCCDSSTTFSSSVAVTARKPESAEGEVTIRPAVKSDFEELQTLLGDAGLPTDGPSIEDAVLAVGDGRVLGGVAVERHGQSALLRSLVVSPERRGHGLGKRLTEAAMEVASKTGAERLYLLTTDAARFFERFGFAEVDRDEAFLDAPSQEFNVGCCDPASAMRLNLGPAALGSDR